MEIVMTFTVFGNASLNYQIVRLNDTMTLERESNAVSGPPWSEVISRECDDDNLLESVQDLVASAFEDANF